MTTTHEFSKAQFDVRGNDLYLSMPMEKVNVEKRTVSGFATLDNRDSQGDVVLKEASVDAFNRARGNIREMHQPKAVGKLVDFTEKTLYGDDGTIYEGIYVTVRVSKGAQDTWEKVLDGTLSGFSIGGNITDSETQWVKDANANVRFVKSYDLIELSLVDNPANQLADIKSFAKANVFSINESDTGETVVKGMVVEVEAQNVFYCGDDSHPAFTELDTDTERTCMTCENEMENIGTISHGEETAEKVGEIVHKFLATKGGVTDMGNENTDTEVKPDAEATATDETAVEPEAEVKSTEDTNVEVNQPDSEADTTHVVVEDEEGTKVVDLDETPENNDLEKVINDLKNVVNKSVEDSRVIAEEATRKLSEEFTKANEAFTTDITEVRAKYDELSKKLDDVKSHSEEVQKSLNALTGSTAFKKSGEVESPEATTKKSSVFGGVFLSADDD